VTNRLYTKAIDAFLTGKIDLSTDDIRCVLVDLADYTPDFDTHEFLSSVPVAARVGTPQSLAGKAVSGGVFDASDITFSSVTGDPCEALIVYKWTGSDATSRLILFVDQATGLPVTPTGADITVSWDNGANKIFRIAPYAGG